MVRPSPRAAVGLFAAALLLGGTQLGSAGGKVDPVKVQASASKADAAGKRTVTVALAIEKGWHVYANPVGLEDLVPAQTKVVIKAAGKPVAASVKYPAGKSHTDKVVGTYQVYEDNVTISADVPGAAGALEVSVTYQACDAKRCLLPKTVKINVP